MGGIEDNNEDSFSDDEDVGNENLDSSESESEDNEDLLDEEEGSGEADEDDDEDEDLESSNEGDDDGDDGEEASSESDEAIQTPPLASVQSKTNAPDAGEPLSLEDEIVAKVKPDYIPGTNEFFDSVEAEAKAKVAKDLGGEFDEFDAKHMARFSCYVNAIAEEKRKVFYGAVESIRKEREAKEVEARVKSEISAALPTKEELENFGQALGGVSVNFFNELKADLQKGDTKSLIDFANKVNGKKVGVAQKSPKKEMNHTQKRKQDRGLVSDLFNN